MQGSPVGEVGCGVAWRGAAAGTLPAGDGGLTAGGLRIGRGLSPMSGRRVSARGERPPNPAAGAA